MEDIFFKNLPKLDLHGEDRLSAIVLVNDFIKESIILNNKKLVIIHGKGTGILKKEVHKYLAHNKNILNYKTSNYNEGSTIVELI